MARIRMNLRVEPRVARLQRVLDAQGGADGSGRDRHLARSDRRAGQREHGIDATARSRVLLPDMFEPLTIRTCGAVPPPA